MKKGVVGKALIKKARLIKNFNADLKRSLPYRLLILFFIVLLILIIVWIAIYLVGIRYHKVSAINETEGVLGSAGVFSLDIEGINFDENLEIISYMLQNDNQTMQIAVRRSANGFGILEKIIFVFNKSQGYCTHNLTSDLPLINEIKFYNISAMQTDCGSNFTSVFQILSFGIRRLTVNLTQINNIPNFNLNEGGYYLGIIDLNDYFASLVDSGEQLNFSYSLVNPNIQLKTSSNFPIFHKLDINTSLGSAGNYILNITLSYPGLQNVTSNNFNLNVGNSVQNCTDSDGGENYNTKGTAINSTYSGTDSCFNITSVQEFYCNGSSVNNYIISCSQNYYCNNGACLRNYSTNRTPEFIQEECGQLSWNKNNNFTLNLLKCFRDPDSDSLMFRFSSHAHLNITLIGTGLLIIPERDWFGSGDFFVYANDSLNEIRATVYFIVNNRISTNLTNTTNFSYQQLKIKGPIPSGEVTSGFFGDSMTFLIGNTDYDTIEWFLDGKIIKTNSASLDLMNLPIGNHSLEVKIGRGKESDSKTWKIIIETEERGRKFVFDVGKIMFYLILTVVFIIIILIVWLFFEERRRKGKKLKLDLKVLEDKKEDMSSSFNIPKI